MKLKRFLKIILLATSILISSIMIFALYSLIIIKNMDLDMGMYIDILTCIMGVLSVIYHFRTLNLYKYQQKMMLRDVSLWVSNLIFALLLIYMSLKLIYIFYDLNMAGSINSNSHLIYLSCFFILLLGICLIFEERWLYNRIINIKKEFHVNSIDDIKGHQENEF